MGPVVRAVGRALPANRASQAEITDALSGLWAAGRVNVERLFDLHKSVKVEARYLALPLSEYPTLDTFEKRNRAWALAAEDLAATCVTRALAEAGIGALDVDHLMFVTVTGIATPSIDARLVNRLGLRPDVKRTPIFGLGCVAGAAGIARAADILKGHPEEHAVLVSVELVERLHGAWADSEARGAGPLFQRTRGLVNSRFALLGDAGGYVDAITGEGLSLAFESARILGETLPLAIHAGATRESLLPYERAYQRVYRRYALFTRALVTLSGRPSWRRRVVRFLAAHPSVFNRVLHRVTGGDGRS